LATITYIPTRRVIMTALQRVVGSRNFVILLSLILGGSLFLWARTELNSMFARDETGEIVVGVGEAGEGCAPPSLYLLPLADAPGSYLGVIDALGGGIADPSIMNIGRPSVALTYDGGAGVDPVAAPRAEAAACPHMVVNLSGGLDRVLPLADADRERVNVAPAANAKMTEEGGMTAFTFDLAEGADEASARVAFRLEGVRDIWQYGYRRINFWNGGQTPLNVFLLGDAGYSFMSQTFDPISVPVRNRSIAAMHLSRPGRESGNAYQVISRLIDYDARLQSRLIMVSTVFGIGISLMVEGVILALLKLARRFRGEGAGGESDLREDDGG
jgi:hypothetical protein